MKALIRNLFFSLSLAGAQYLWPKYTNYWHSKVIQKTIQKECQSLNEHLAAESYCLCGTSNPEDMWGGKQHSFKTFPSKSEEQWLEKCLFIPYPYGSGEVKALCKTQCSSPLSCLWPGLLSFLNNFYVKLKGFLVAVSTLKCVWWQIQVFQKVAVGFLSRAC